MKKIILLIVSISIVNPVFAFGLQDIGHVFDKSYKCKNDDQACKNRQHLLAVAKVAAVAVAAKYIVDMVVEHKAKKLADEKAVAKDYKDQHTSLPEKAEASVYTTTTEPGNVVQPGKKVVIKSDIVVVPGRDEKDTVIQERMAIFDNEDHEKELKSLTKNVNEGTKRAGHYTNEFSFTLPEGLPQGVYPIKNTLLINGEEIQSANNDLQLVLHVDERGRQFIASIF